MAADSTKQHPSSPPNHTTRTAESAGGRRHQADGQCENAGAHSLGRGPLHVRLDRTGVAAAALQEPAEEVVALGLLLVLEGQRERGGAAGRGGQVGGEGRTRGLMRLVDGGGGVLGGCQVLACVLLSGYESALSPLSFCSSSTTIERERDADGPGPFGRMHFRYYWSCLGAQSTHLGQNCSRAAQRGVAEGRERGGAGPSCHKEEEGERAHG